MVLRAAFSTVIPLIMRVAPAEGMAASLIRLMRMIRAARPALMLLDRSPLCGR